jgi:hypothetical protein
MHLGMLPTAHKRLQLLQYPAVPFQKKRNAIFWASSNCDDTRNNRVAVVKVLQKLLANSSLSLESYGRCLQNVNASDRVNVVGHSGASTKIIASATYKFCIVSGSSVAPVGRMHCQA